MVSDASGVAGSIMMPGADGGGSIDDPSCCMSRTMTSGWLASLVAVRERERDLRGRCTCPDFGVVVLVSEDDRAEKEVLA